MERSHKDQIVADLSERLTRTDAIFVTDFKGLDVEAMSALRRKVSEAGGDYQVIKNTLLRIAAKETDLAQLTEMFIGNNALGTTNGDPASLAKALVDFAKNNEKLIIKGGILSGKVLSPSQINGIASLPTREVLLGILLGAMNAVPTKLVRVLNAIPSNLVYALSAIRDQKEEA